MKRILILITLVMAIGFSSMAQKFAYVDSEAILNQVPAYKEALKQIDALAEEWQAEISKEYNAIDRLYKNFQAESVLLTEDMRIKREEEIVDREKQVKALQKKKFGVDGELFKKRQELINPIQQKIAAAIAKMANQKAYDFVLDKSANSGILFANDKFDKSEEILNAVLK